jgi:hypothetical protein
MLRCIWTDHRIDNADQVAYRVTPMVRQADASFSPVSAQASDWTPPVLPTSDAGDGLSALFNRGTLMSQIVSRFVGNNINVATLKNFKAKLSEPGFPARRYLSGHARHEILSFLADADQWGNEVYAALYEVTGADRCA